MWSNDRFSSTNTKMCLMRGSSFGLCTMHGSRMIHVNTRRMNQNEIEMTSLQIVVYVQWKIRHTHFETQFHAMQTIFDTHTTASHAQLHGHQSQHWV